MREYWWDFGRFFLLFFLFWSSGSVCESREFFFSWLGSASSLKLLIGGLMSY